MGHVVNLTELVTFEREDCCSCGVTFFIPADLRARRKNDAQSFYCPNGHGQSYSKSEADQLRAKVKEWEVYAESQKKRKEWAEQEAKNEQERRLKTERRLTAAKGQQTKLRNRIKNGVCPCCTRTFSNLQRHMANQHPDFTAEPPETVI